MKPHELWAIIQKLPNGEKNILGLFHSEFGHLACVHSKREVVEEMWQRVAPEVRIRSKITKFVEVES